MPRTLRLVLASFFVPLLACGSSPPPGSPGNGEASELGDAVRAAAKAVVVCKTTEAELRAAMHGATPFRDGRIHLGRIVSWVASKSPERFLAVLLDERGVVVDLLWDTPGGATWDPRSQCPAP